MKIKQKYLLPLAVCTQQTPWEKRYREIINMTNQVDKMYLDAWFWFNCLPCPVVCLCPAHYHSVSRVEPSVSIQTRHSPTKSLLYFTDHAINSHFNSRLFGESIDAGNCDHFDCKSNTVILTDDHSWESQYHDIHTEPTGPNLPTCQVPATTTARLNHHTDTAQ